MQTIDLIIGGIYTIIVISLSGIVGFLLGSREFKRILDEKVLRTKSVPTTTGGAVRQITPQEIEANKDNKSARIKELLSDDL